MHRPSVSPSDSASRWRNPSTSPRAAHGGDVGLQQMRLPHGSYTPRSYSSSGSSRWSSSQPERQHSYSDYAESRSLSSRSFSILSTVTSSNTPRNASRNERDAVPTDTSCASDDAHIRSRPKENDFKHRSKADGFSQAENIKQGVASLGMHAGQRHHSNASTASTAISASSFSSNMTTHSRLTSKFPIPRLVHSASTINTKGSESGGSSKLLLAQPSSEKERADVAARIAHQDARERKARWTKAKWLLLLSVTSVFMYGLGGLLLSLLAWFRTSSNADVLIVAEKELLIYITLASGMCLVTALVGLVGTMLNSRPILAIYNLLLWPTLAAILVVGYTSYRKQALNLDRKLNQAWSQFFDDAARLRLQNSLHCCGYYSPLHQATFSKKCYPRTPLPGCKGKLFRFEKDLLHRIAMATFSVVPVHLLNIFIALLCSNHVNRSFGKGLMPRQYRLSILDVRENAMQALRALPLRPKEIKTGRGNTTESTYDFGRERIPNSSATGIASLAQQRDWTRLRGPTLDVDGQMHHMQPSGRYTPHSSYRLRRPTGEDGEGRRRRGSGSPSGSEWSLASLPRYNANLKGLGLS